MKKTNIDFDVFDFFGEGAVSEEEQIHPYWLNDKQIAFKTATQPVKTWMGGRGSGKTNIEADHINDCRCEMPGSRGFIYGPDLTQLGSKELVEIFDVWKRYEIFEYDSIKKPEDEFVFGVKPPKSWKVIYRYKVYANVISFKDGSVLELISEKFYESNKGGSYDYGIVVEAVNCTRSLFFKYIFPMVRGEIGKYKSKKYLSWAIFSNQTYDVDGEWVSNMGEEAKKNPNRYFYLESTIHDNVDFFGSKYITDLQDYLEKNEPLMWAVEYMNQRKFKSDISFYRYLEDKHLYDEIDNVDPHHDATRQSLKISQDFNKNFNTLTVYQRHKSHEDILACLNFFVTYSNDLWQKIIQEFIDYYEYRHFHKKVEIYGDVNGHYLIDPDNNKTYYQNIKELFELNGWEVVIKVERTTNPSHFDKHQKINVGLAEEIPEKCKLRVNRKKAKPVWISMLKAKKTSNFKKNKDSEKKLKGKDRLSATDLSDGVDYIYYPILKESNGSNKNVMTIETF